MQNGQGTPKPIGGAEDLSRRTNHSRIITLESGNSKQRHVQQATDVYGARVSQEI